MLPALPVLADDAAVLASAPAPPRPVPIDQDVSHVDWRIWEPEHQHGTLELHGGPLFWRRVGSERAQSDHGWVGSVGGSTLVRVRPFVMFQTNSLMLRVFDSASYAVSFVQELSAGLVLGPLEPDVRAGFAVVTLDAFHGNWSAELFSPRVAAGAWLRVGRLGIGVHAFGEYLWRWFGDGSVLERGVLFSLSIER